MSGQSSSGATAAAVLDQKEAESPLETDHKKRKRGKKVPFKDLSEEQKKLRREKFRGRNQRRKEKKRALLELHSNLAPSQTTEQQHAYLGSSSQDNKDGGGTSQQNDSHAHQTSCAGKAKSAQAAVQELAVKSGSKERNSDTYQLAPFKIQIEKVGGVCTKKDFANVQQAFIKAVLSIPSGEARLAANPIRIRQSRLLDGKVVVIVWDSHSKDFIIEAITDLPDFSAAVQDGTARFSFIISSDWCYEKPADLIGVLERKNPRLPSGSLTFVSWTSRGPNGSRVFVDVNKEGISVLQDCKYM